jgi:hypothetical protein
MTIINFDKRPQNPVEMEKYLGVPRGTIKRMTFDPAIGLKEIEVDDKVAALKAEDIAKIETVMSVVQKK